MPDATDLAALETRLEAVLDPYRDRLEASTSTACRTCAGPAPRPTTGSRASARASGVIRFFLLPMHHHPELLDGHLARAAQAQDRQRSLFAFTALDDDSASELEGSWRATVPGLHGRPPGAVPRRPAYAVRGSARSSGRAQGLPGRSGPSTRRPRRHEPPANAISGRQGLVTGLTPPHEPWRGDPQEALQRATTRIARP